MQDQKAKVAQEFIKFIGHFKQEIKKPNIIACGYTGSGKTSLIQGILGKAIVSDDKIVHGKPGTMDFVHYQNELLNIWDSKGFEPGQTEEEFIKITKEFIRKKQTTNNVDTHIHIAWYCIQGSGARVTNSDIELITKILDNVIVLITKKDITRKNQADGIIAELTKKGVSQDRILLVDNEDIESLKKVADLSYEMLPKAYRDAFLSAEILNIEKKDSEASIWIHSASVAAGAAGAIPIPVSDALIITPIQIGLIVKLAYLYGIESEAIKASSAALLAELAGVLTASSLIKLIPFAGSAIQAGVAASLTEILGFFMKNYFHNCAVALSKNMPMPEFPPLDEFKKILSKKI